MTVRKSFYEAIGGFDPALRGVITEDWEFNLRALSKGRTALCRRVLARVRYHSGSQSDNAIGTLLGSAKVLRYALEKNEGTRCFESEIDSIIKHHSASAFNAAFAVGEFQLAKTALQQPYLALDDSRFMWKKRIVSMPCLLRYVMWFVSQIFSTLQIKICHM